MSRIISSVDLLLYKCYINSGYDYLIIPLMMLVILKLWQMLFRLNWLYTTGNNYASPDYARRA